MSKNNEYMCRVLYSILPAGIENALHQDKIASLLNIRPAAVKRLVRMARNEYRYPICSGRQGYWLAKDDLELQKFTSRHKGQAISMLQTSNALKSNDEIKGQITLSEYFSEDSYCNISCSDNLIMIDESDFKNIDKSDFNTIDNMPPFEEDD